jgi:hypothetical protein
MNLKKESIQINLNSKYATQNFNAPLNSSLYFSFPSLLQEDPAISYKTVSVTNAQIPVSFYIINEYNNTLFWDDDGTLTTTTFTLGNYTATQFITEWKNQISNNFPLTINRNTGIFTFQHNKLFTFYGNGSTIFEVLGFDPSQDYSSTTGGGQHTLTAPYLCNFAGITRLSIRSSVLTVQNRDAIDNGSSTFEITTIPVNVPSYGVIKYENIVGFEGVLNVKSLNGFDIQIYDDDGNLIDFNGVHWNISLQINIYKQVQNEDIKTLGEILKSNLESLGNVADSGSGEDSGNVADSGNIGSAEDSGNVEDAEDSGNVEDAGNQEVDILGNGGLDEFLLTNYGIDL